MRPFGNHLITASLAGMQMQPIRIRYPIGLRASDQSQGSIRKV